MGEAALRRLGGYAVFAGVAACLVTPLLGLAWFGTADGVDALDSGSVSWWADPARDWLDPLLTWASADRVYSTYVQAMALLFPALLLAAFHAARTRTPRTRVERIGWRVMLTGYLVALTGVTLVSALLIPFSPSSDAVDVAFLALMVPGTLLSTFGSTMLGISLLRGRWQPRATGWLLAIAFPFWFVVSIVLGHNGLGMLAMFLAWAWYGRAVLLASPGIETANGSGSLMSTVTN